MAASLPPCVDTVIIGNGPSALILSYVLHGHIPYYIGRHHDALLDQKLSKEPCLLHLDRDHYAHFLSSLRYSTAALPVNTLLDTLVRPNADTEINPKSCVEWRYEPDKHVSHVVVGNAPQPGGQWAEKTVSASEGIGTLSYAEQLSLPGYSYADHVAKRGGDADQCDFMRPSRTEVADYLKAYPKAVGISDAIFNGTEAHGVYRIPGGFVIGSLGIRCKHLVLASGIFTVNIPPPPLLAPIANLDIPEEPLLVIGSGFSAADVIISAPPNRRIIHIYNWAPETRPSPLRGCHHTAYPEYATVYRQMKLASVSSSKALSSKSPLLRRKSNPFFRHRDWSSTYEGLPNATLLSASPATPNSSANVTIRLASGEEITRKVGALSYVVGRRGSLSYLSPPLLAQILSSTDTPSSTLISNRTLRAKAELSLEIAPSVFVIGSLAGDSLIRHAIGGCVFAAGRILGAIPPSYTASSSAVQSAAASPYLSADSSEEEYSASSTPSRAEEEISLSSGSSGSSPVLKAGGHEDLHVDRRRLTRKGDIEVDIAVLENRLWVETGWWAGGLGYRGGGGGA